MEPGHLNQRSRDGCWTCRRRRKKCDNTSFPCNNCKRLHLDCERGTRLVWEDDSRRHGMRRRGPPSRKADSQPATEAGPSPVVDALPGTFSTLFGPLTSMEPDGLSADPVNHLVPTWDMRLLAQVSDWPFDLDPTDCQLLDRYTKLFSTTYPTCIDPTNPFLRVLLPLSMRSRPVLDAMLALGCVQSWENGDFTMKISMLRYISKAIRGCRDLVNRTIRKSSAHQVSPPKSGEMGMDHVITSAISGAVDDGPVTELLAICVLLMLYEKLSGESPENGTTHLQIFARLLPSHLFVTMLDRIMHCPTIGHQNDAIIFLSNLFLYNDLVMSTSLRTPTLSNFYLCNSKGSPGPPPTEQIRDRFYFPGIIARISSNDESVTDADIAAWSGRLDWLPSFALQPLQRDEQCGQLPTSYPNFVCDPLFERLESFTLAGTWDEDILICEFYRVAATMYRRQCQPDRSGSPMGNLPSWAIAILRLLPPESQYETALLWPIAIMAQGFTRDHDRRYILHRLQMLERRFKMKNYSTIRERLLNMWDCPDDGKSWKTMQATQPFLFG